MKLIITRKKQWVGKLAGIKIYINGEYIGKVYENKPLKIECKTNNLKIEAKQLIGKKKLLIENPNEKEILEIYYTLTDMQLLIYGLIVHIIAILYFIYKPPNISYILIITQIWFLYKLTNKNSIKIKRKSKQNAQLIST